MEQSKGNNLLAALLKTELAQFTGTTQYHRNWSGMHYTDGVQHLAHRAAAYWLIDAIGSWQAYLRPVDGGLQVWELTIRQDCSAVLVCTIELAADPVVQQRISYTDFPLKSIALWVEQGILMLPSEH
jgi:hypothetical protein